MSLIQIEIGEGRVRCDQNRLFGCGKWSRYVKKGHRLPVRSGRVRVMGFTSCEHCNLPLSVVRNARKDETEKFEKEEK